MTEFENNGDPPAAYLAVVAMAKLNTLFNDISVFAINSTITQAMVNPDQTGISSGQADFQGLINDVFNNFIKPYELSSLNGPGPFIAALISVLASFLILIPGVGLLASALIQGGAALLGAGLEELLDKKPLYVVGDLNLFEKAQANLCN